MSGGDEEKKVDRKLSSLSRFGLRGRGRGAGPSRLPSLKPARDLTLGGTPKRTFTPNIVSRSAKKDDDFDNDPRARSIRERNRGRNRGKRGRGARGRGDVISASSIFSQGPAAQQTLARALTGGGFYGGGGDREESAGSSRSASRSIKGELEEELDSSKVLEMLKEEGKIELDEDEVKLGSLVPITLPLASKLSHKIKPEELKAESELSQDEDDSKPKVILDEKKPNLKESSLPTVEIPDLFKEDAPNDQLFFFQFPDTLPIQALSHEDDDIKTESAKTTAEEDDFEEQLRKFTFQNVSEGNIGKLQLHKSGKVTMRLGNVSLDVSLGTPCGFLQDLISIHLERDPPEMVSVGHVNHRLIAVPNYESLLGLDMNSEDDEDDL